MTSYYAQLYVTPNDRYTTEGCLDSSVFEGVSKQRTLNMITTPDEVIVVVRDGAYFETTNAITVTPGIVLD